MGNALKIAPDSAQTTETGDSRRNRAARNPAAAGSLLDGLVTPEQYRTEREHIFPTEHALLHQIRVNKQALIQKRALFLIGNRTHIHPQRFERVIVDAGLAQLTSKVRS